MALTKRDRRKARRRLKALAGKPADIQVAEPAGEIPGVLIASRMIQIAGRHGPQWAARLLMGQIGVEGEQRLASQAEAEIREERINSKGDGHASDDETRRVGHGA